MRHIAICDDNAQDRVLLQDLLCNLLQTDCHIHLYETPETLLDDVHDQLEAFSILFLDVMMPPYNGVEVAGKLRELGCRTPIIFTTTSPEFAVQSYDVNASGYLVKPIGRDSLKKNLDRIFGNRLCRKIPIQRGREVILLNCYEIMWVESDKHMLYIHLVDGSVVEVREKLDAFAELLTEPYFLRIHKSYLINMDFVQRVEKEFTMADGANLPIPVRKHREIVDAYLHYTVSHALTEG